MNLSALFIKRPVATTLIQLAIVIFGVIGYRALPVSDLPSVDFPTIQVNAGLPGANPETMAAAVATPLEKQFATISGITSISSTQHGSAARTITLQFDLDRDIDAAAQDVQGAISRTARSAAAGHAGAAVVPEGEPGGLADPVPDAQLADAAAVGDQRVRRDQRRAAHLDAEGRRAGQRSSARRSSPCGSTSIRGSSRRASSTSTRWPRRVSARQRQPADRHALRPGPHVRRQDRRPADQRRRRSGRSSSPTATAGRCGSTRSRNVYDGVENDKTASWYNDPRTIYLAVQRQPGTNTVEIVDSIRALLPQIQAQLPAALSLGDPQRPVAVDPRVGPRHQVHAGADRRARRAGHLPVPAQHLGDDHPQPRAAGLDRRHVRGDVRCSATASTTCR